MYCYYFCVNIACIVLVVLPRHAMHKHGLWRHAVSVLSVGPSVHFVSRQQIGRWHAIV